MSEGEIRMMYRQAKNRKMQIRILSELTLKPKEEIVRIINGGTIEPPKPKLVKPINERHKGKGMKWTEEETLWLLEAMQNGVKTADMVEHLGRSYYAVSAKMYQHRRMIGGKL